MNKTPQGNENTPQKGEGVKDMVHASSDTSLVSFLYKKTEKLGTAIYMVTDFMSESEPIKWQLRTLGVELLRTTSRLHYKTFGGRVIDMNEMVQKGIEVVTLLEFARSSGLISEMNFSILKSEFDGIMHTASERMQQRDPLLQPILSREFFEYEEPAMPHTNKGQEHIKDNQKEEAREQRGEQHKDTPTPAAHKDTEHKRQNVARAPKQYESTRASDKGQTSVHAGGSPSARKAQSSKKASAKGKSDRKETIEKLLRKRGRLTIKDISANIPGCSEKTVQRELNAMIDDHVVKREGERRWSRYSLA